MTAENPYEVFPDDDHHYEFSLEASNYQSPDLNLPTPTFSSFREPVAVSNDYESPGADFSATKPVAVDNDYEIPRAAAKAVAVDNDYEIMGPGFSVHKATDSTEQDSCATLSSFREPAAVSNDYEIPGVDFPAPKLSGISEPNSSSQQSDDELHNLPSPTFSTFLGSDT